MHFIASWVRLEIIEQSQQKELFINQLIEHMVMKLVAFIRSEITIE